MISSLKYSISRDPNYFVKAAIDPMYKNIRPQIDSLLKTILEETRKNVQIQVANLEKYIKKMEKWFFGNYASNDELRLYDSIKYKIKEIHSKLSLHSYFDYDDALQLAFSAREEVNNIQLSIKNMIKYLEDGIKSNESKLISNSNEFSNVHRKYHKDMLYHAFGLISVPLILYYGSSWFNSFFFKGQSYISARFIIGIIIGFIIVVSVAGSAFFLIVVYLGLISEFFEKNKKHSSYKRNVSTDEKRITQEIITFKQKIAIAKESII